MKEKRTVKSLVHSFIVKRAFLLVFFAIAMMVIVYQFEVNHYVNRFIETRTENFEEFIQNNQQNLKSYAQIHSHWDDLIKKIESDDEAWIKANASQYLLEDPLYEVDFVYIRDEKTGYEEVAGIDEDGKEELLSNSIYFKGLRDFEEDIYLINGESYLVNGSYLSLSDKIENRGFYFVGRKIDNSFLSAMRSMMNTEMIRGIELQQEVQQIQYPKFFGTQIGFSVPITRENVEQTMYLRFTYDLEFIKEFYYWGEIALMVFIFYFALTLATEIIRKGEPYIMKLKSFEGKVKLMAKGQYGMHFDSVGVSELDSLMSSMDLLSDSLKAYRHKVHKDKVDMIGLLVKAVDINDHYTKGHSERVAKRAKELAVLIGYQDPKKIEIAGLLHDVGKISVPSHMLNKPGRLTDGEFDVIKNHSELGYELLVQSEVFSDIRRAVRFHHERVDGRGYPMGLKGEDIPIEAMLISICDVYDALVTDRPYRKAMSHGNAMQIICNESGKAFTEELVEAFSILIEESLGMEEDDSPALGEYQYGK